MTELNQILMICPQPYSEDSQFAAYLHKFEVYDKRWAVSVVDLNYNCMVGATIEIEDIYKIYV
jgi:hypothetical protein